MQFEIRDDTTVKLDVVSAFEVLGYESYRLVPGLQVLVPFNPADDHDPFLLNLFACTPFCHQLGQNAAATSHINHMG